MRVITCPVCSDPYPLYLFEFGIPFWCRCGAIIGRPTEDPNGGDEGRGNPPREFHETPWEEPSFDDPYEGEDHPPHGNSPYGLDDASGYAPSSSRRVYGAGPEFQDAPIELSSQEWQELRAELEARDGHSQPEFDWPYNYDSRFAWEQEDEKKARELQRRADRICYLISATDYSAIEIDKEKQSLADRCRRYFPEIEHAYEKVYERRFNRLWKQFRDAA